ncbi:MAG: hypothetical protein ACE37B_10280 [Ilumatobacter sp.]
MAEFSLGAAYSGAQTVVHNGAELAILDEAMAWVCIAIERAASVSRGTRW